MSSKRSRKPRRVSATTVEDQECYGIRSQLLRMTDDSSFTRGPSSAYIALAPLALLTSLAGSIPQAAMTLVTTAALKKLRLPLADRSLVDTSQVVFCFWKPYPSE